MVAIPPQVSGVLSDTDQAVVEKIRTAFLASEKGTTQQRRRWEHFYSLYRSYRDFRDQYDRAQPRDRDEILTYAKREWGASLFIPATFSTVEAIVPRMVANRPKMLILPRDPASDDNVKNMRLLVNAQQDNFNYELVLQDVAKDGIVFGLGVQKTYWKHEYDEQRVLAPSMFDPDIMVPTLQNKCVYDDPIAEAVDPLDGFYWDPFADDVCNCDYIIHRTWRSVDYCMDQLRPVTPDDPASAAWGTIAAQALTEEDVRGLASARYNDVLQRRQQAEGLSGASSGPGGRVEVWEYHDGTDVITVLGRQVPVANKPNPLHNGELPFQVFRPTHVPHRMVGIGVVEPMEDLQAEMNVLRSQRRDNATIVLNAPFVYQRGLVDPDDIKFGPGIAIGVDGDPNELLRKLPVNDIPGSGYQEEDRMRADMERTSGISDQTQGVSSMADTATGAQIQNANAAVRIQNYLLRLELEVLRPAARCFVALNQQHILAPKSVRQPDPGGDEGRWQWVQVTPQELQGEFVCVPDGGSTAPENIPQQVQNAQILNQILAQSPQVDHQQLNKWTLEQFGIKNPEVWLQPPVSIPPQALQIIEQEIVKDGVNPGKARQMIVQAVQEAQQANQQPPGTPQGQMPEPPPGQDQGQQGPPQQQQGPPDQGPPRR